MIDDSIKASRPRFVPCECGEDATWVLLRSGRDEFFCTVCANKQESFRDYWTWMPWSDYRLAKGFSKSDQVCICDGSSQTRRCRACYHDAWLDGMRDCANECPIVEYTEENASLKKEVERLKLLIVSLYKMLPADLTGAGDDREPLTEARKIMKGS